MALKRKVRWEEWGIWHLSPDGAFLSWAFITQTTPPSLHQSCHHLSSSRGPCRGKPALLMHSSLLACFNTYPWRLPHHKQQYFPCNSRREEVHIPLLLLKQLLLVPFVTSDSFVSTWRFLLRLRLNILNNYVNFNHGHRYNKCVPQKKAYSKVIHF